MRLADKVAIVTGSARGIGRAIAIEFGREGASVVVNYESSEAKANEAVKMIKGFGSRAIAVQGDVGVMNDRRKLVDATIKEFGRVDILVNNAGLHFVFPTVDTVTEEGFNRTMAVNVGGNMFMSQLVAPYMLKQGKGAIVNVSTASIFVAPPDSPQYFASKGAIETLTRSLASLLGPQIRVNCVAPGCIDTDMLGHHSLETKQFLASTTPLLRIGRAEEVAMAALFLASDEASFITGATLRVDGGRTTGTGHSGGFDSLQKSIKPGAAKY
jgi:NAD(P)-dependent dehydrogenase (short-subunit alcohol dehydrogenase family)